MRFVIFVVGALLLLLALAGASLGLSTQGKQDFGDAPDGRPTGYGPVGQFPSLMKSDGARAADTTVAFLGKRANKEGNARIVDRDRFDDGVFLNMKSCQKSEAFVVVTKPDTSATGTAYVNLFFDWDQNGAWEGRVGGCGQGKTAEWTVKNFKINLSKQTGKEAVYRVSFRAGRVPTGMWYRAILTIDGPWKGPGAAGAFPSGEVEDYVITQPAGYYCDPYFGKTLVHGTKASFVIKKGDDDAPEIVRTALARGVKPVTPEREIRLKKGSVDTYEYVSKKVHVDPRSPVPESFNVVVNGAHSVRCFAWVIHGKVGPPGIGPVSDKPDGGKPGGGDSGGGPATGNLLSNVSVSEGSIENINGVNQKWVCLEFETVAGTNWEVAATFENSSTPFYSQKGKAAKDGKFRFDFNTPAEQGHVLHILIAAELGANTKEFKKALKFALQAVGAKCPSR